MKKFKFSKNLSLVVLLAVAITLGFSGPSIVYAATSPILVGSAAYSVLGATPAVTNTGATTTTVGEVGISPAASITGFPPGTAALNNALHLHFNDASAIAAQADNLAAFGFLNTGTGNTDGDCMDPTTLVPGSIASSATDLRGLTLGPGLYCSDGSFLLTDGAGTDLTLTGAGPWVFKTVSTLIISNGASVTGPTNPLDACKVWWRVGSSATLGTTAAFLGNILAHTTISMKTGATLYGRAMAYEGTVTLDSNIISGCATALVPPHLTLDKIVVGGSSAESAWTLTADGPLPLSGPGAAESTDVSGSVTPGTYTLSESTGPTRYTASLWSCVKNDDAAVLDDSIILDYNDTAVCTITNTYHAPSSGGGGYMQPAFLPSINILSTPVVIAPIIPKLPKTGFPPEERSAMLPVVILSGLSLVSIFLYFAQKKQTS